MGYAVRGFWLLVLIAVGLAVAGPAAAESRLFTVRTDAPNVTIVRAVHNGVELPVAGQSAGSTFFRIDNPSGPVPCLNRIVFVTSTGQSLDTTLDLCATNWEVVVAVGGGQPSIPSAGQPVVIAVDDPAVSIMEVFMRGRAVPIGARQGAYVRVVAPTEAGPGCERDLGLALSDGRRIARMVDICATNFVVVVPIAGGPRPPPPPQSFLPPQPELPAPQPQPLPQPEPQPLPQPVPPSRPDFVDTMVWMLQSAGATSMLAYGIPNSDAGEFSAVCQQGSGQMTVTLDRAPPDLTPGRQVAVRFTAGGYSQVYTATGGPVSELSGHSHPVLQIAATDPLWPALARENVVSIAIGQMAPYGLSLRGSAANVRPFLGVCAGQPQPPPSATPQPGPPPGASVVGFVCNDGIYLSVAFDEATAMVTEPGYPPVVLLRTPSQGGARYVGGGAELIGLADRILWTRSGTLARSCMRG